MSRQQQFERLAYQLDMEYSPKDEWGLKTLLKDFKLFRRGGRKRIKNLLHQQSDLHQLDTRIFDYQFTISTGNSSRTFKQTVFFVESKSLGLPQFWMKPESFFHKVGAFLGFEDIDFEEYPKFSENYYLKGEDEEYIRSTLNDEFLKFFSVEKKWYLEGLNYYMIFYRFNDLLPPHEVKNLHEKGLQLAEMLKQEPFLP
ncbi:MAG: hypothetical protein HRU41_17910 [Saprospiraceae bacterium]|nr:hypothetical protein [Saprospiraceae bacterium]